MLDHPERVVSQPGPRLALTQLEQAIFYALRCGCFFPVPRPRRGASVEELKKWGALRHFHDVAAERFKELGSKLGEGTP